MELDFTNKTVLIVGGSSGIGSGVARALLNKGALVHVGGTRAAAEDYAATEGSDRSGLHYHHCRWRPHPRLAREARKRC